MLKIELKVQPVDHFLVGVREGRNSDSLAWMAAQSCPKRLGSRQRKTAGPALSPPGERWVEIGSISSGRMTSKD